MDTVQAIVEGVKDIAVSNDQKPRKEQKEKKDKKKKDGGDGRPTELSPPPDFIDHRIQIL